MNDSPYKLTIGLSVLHFLGPNLYDNIAAVLSEMVANAWDADAKKVEININIPKDEIVVEDDGLGMSLQSINEKYLYVGYLRRDTEYSTTTPSGRHVMGRKGIGKLAAFSFANEMQIFSNNGKELVGCKIDWDAIEEAIADGKTYTPTPLDPSKVKSHRGTEVILKKLKKEKLKDIKSIRRRLARRFLIFDGRKDFQVLVEGNRITSKEDCPFYNKMEYVWYFGDESEHYVSLFPNLKRTASKLDGKIEYQGRYLQVRGWMGTVEEPSNIREDENNTIALYAHGKMIQEDILGEYQEAQNYAQYIVGNIEVDFLDSDDEPDIVTSDRQRVIQDDQRYITVKEFIRGCVREVGRNWSLWRLEKKSASALEDKKVKAWYDNLSSTSKRKATRILGKIDEIENIPGDQRKSLYDASMKEFDGIKDISGSALKSMDDERFLDLLKVDISKSPTTTEAPIITEPDKSDGKSDKAVSRRRTTIENNFSEIQKILEKLVIEQSLKDIALYDLDQARKSYNGGAYKASAVMFGAILEGVMLGIIRREDVQDKILADYKNAPQVLQSFGLAHPDQDRNVLLQRISSQLGFEEFKVIISYLDPEIEKLKIDGIQVFRNTIHPWLSIQTPKIYANIDLNRFSNLQTSLIILLGHLADWKP